MNWQSFVLGELIEVDSFGEFDDIVIEDIIVDILFEGNKIQVEKFVFVLSVVVKIDEREVNKIFSCNRGSKIFENLEGLVIDFELRSVQFDVFEGSLVGGEAVCVYVFDVSVLSEQVKQLGSVREVFFVRFVISERLKRFLVFLDVCNEIEFLLNVIIFVCLGLFYEKSVKDIDDFFLEDLVVVFIEIRERGIVDEGEVCVVILEKIAGFKLFFSGEVLYEGELGGFEIKDVKGKYIE